MKTIGDCRRDDAGGAGVRVPIPGYPPVRVDLDEEVRQLRLVEEAMSKVAFGRFLTTELGHDQQRRRAALP